MSATEPTPTAAPAPGFDRRDVVLRVAAAVGLVFSAMLLVDYTHAPVFCGEAASGCDAVRRSSWSRVAGVPVPVYGTLFFTAMLVAAALATPLARRALAVLGGASVAAGLAFVGIQAGVLHHFCKLCVVVDSSAIVAGACALSLARDELAPLGLPLRLPTAAVAILSLVGPLGYGLSQPPPRRHDPAPVIEPMPDVIAREQSAGKATIVEFVDFECPFCRRQQEALAPVLASYGDRVRLVRRNVPLSFHEHARGAARAQCCAEEQGRGERMADQLFRAEDLTEEGCNRIAERLGLDMAAYRACLASRRPDVLLERDQNDARAANVSGLPTLWIGREKFEGFTSPEALRASIDRALEAASRPAQPPGPTARSGT